MGNAGRLEVEDGGRRRRRSAAKNPTRLLGQRRLSTLGESARRQEGPTPQARNNMRDQLFADTSMFNLTSTPSVPKYRRECCIAKTNETVSAVTSCDILIHAPVLPVVQHASDFCSHATMK